MRSRIAVAVLAAFLLLVGVFVVILAVYLPRVVTELSPGSWKTPTRILDRNGKPILELYGAEWRLTDPVVLEKLPKHVPNAFLAAEDVRFYRHFGIDPRGVGRAALTNLRSGGIAQGGSTITQQLVKTRFLTAERTFTRKGIEAILSILVELRLSKEEILEAYLNDVYLGHRDGRTIAGLDEASRAYFDKSPQKLTLAEAALLAGIVRAPNRDNPDERAKVAKQRRDAVLGVMLAQKWIDQADHDAAIDDRVRFRPGKLRTTPHPYLVAALRSEIAERANPRSLRTGGLQIHTSIDARMQRAAEDAVRGGTRRLQNRYSWLRKKEPLQAAILSVDPRSGGIRALVGGSDFRKSQFDRTRRMRRQPGSALKPFTYAAALARKTITPSSVVEDKAVEIRLARNDIWRPQNYDERFRGRVTVREAFEKSLNTPAVRIADEVGVGEIRELLDDAGIEGELSDTPAIALGVDDVSMRELIAAYTIFPNLGLRTEPHLIDRIETSSGRRIYRFRGKRKKLLDPAVAYVVHSLLRGVVQRGTASDLSHLGLGYIAGKTGTTNDYRDAWFVGYAPDLLTATWVGFDGGTPLRISSAEAALPIWAAFMTKAPHAHAEIKAPDGVHLVPIELASGLVWRSGCGPRIEEAFLSGTEPSEKCPRRIERPPILIEFREPPVITPEESAERATEVPGDVQIVIDPAASNPSTDDDPDELSEAEQREVDRQVEEALKALEKQRPDPSQPVPTPAPADPVLPPPEEPKSDDRDEKEERKEEKRDEKERKPPDG